jgi:hypothetical protein
VSSALIRVEAVRACARYGSEYARAARDGLRTIALLPLDDQVLEWASALEPADTRSLDAIHLASALSVADDLGVVLSYDERLCRAARASGLHVESPR